MTVRPATPDDAEAVKALGTIIFSEATGTKMGDAVRDVGTKTGRLGCEKTHSIQAAYWLIEDGVQPVGIIGLYSPRWIGPQNLYLGWFGVHPDYRRQGLGEKLMGVAVEEARKLGARSILVETFPDEGPTTRFYDRLGFSEVARVSDYWGDSSPLVLLRKSL